VKIDIMKKESFQMLEIINKYFNNLKKIDNEKLKERCYISLSIFGLICKKEGPKEVCDDKLTTPILNELIIFFGGNYKSLSIKLSR
jgi:hypothetical protein